MAKKDFKVDSDIVLRKRFSKDTTQPLETRRWLSKQVRSTAVTLSRYNNTTPSVLPMTIEMLRVHNMTIEDIFQLDENDQIVFNSQKLIDLAPETMKFTEKRIWVTKQFSKMSIGMLYNWECGDIPHVFFCLLKMKELSGCELKEFLIEK